MHLALIPLPLLAWWIGEARPFSLRVVLVTVAAIALALDRLRPVFPAWGRFIESLVGPVMRNDERTGILGSTLLVVALAITFTILSRSVALAAMLFLVVGDAAAALVGGRFGRRRWTGHATIEGSLACLAGTLAVVPLVGWLDPRMSRPALVAGALIASLVEAIVPGRIDNLAMPLASGTVMQFAVMGN